MKIISASRRTDIPAYYAEWFMNRIRAGLVEWRNPFSGQIVQTSLASRDVAAIVFWSKNYRPLLPHLSELHDRGFHFVFHFTITGLPQIFESNVPHASEMVKVARQLADTYGPETVLWRYDPILVSSACSLDCHRRRFVILASELAGATTRCYFSFPSFYAKTIRNAAALERETGIRFTDLTVQDKIAFAGELADIAAAHGITMYSCCGDSLLGGRIRKAHCVDAELLARLYPNRITRARLNGTRQDCGCYASTDIGAYDTCPHGCVYCYANANKQVAAERWNLHDPAAERL